MMTERQLVSFPSNGTPCEAWHYPGGSGACVVMAAGLGVTKEPGTDPLAKRFADAGLSVLAFDYRRLGGSGGEPRQVVRVRDQLADWDAAIAFAKELPEVDAERIAIWGFSLSGGHVFKVAANHPELAAAVAHAPIADGLDGIPNALRQIPLRGHLRVNMAATRDTLRRLLRRPPVLIPLTGPTGSLASLTTPDAQNSPRALNPLNSYQWDQRVNASIAVRIGFYRPGRVAPRIRVPLLVMAFMDEGVAPPGPAIVAAERAPRGEVIKLSGGHYETFLGDQADHVERILRFLDLHAGLSSERLPAAPAGSRRPCEGVSTPVVPASATATCARRARPVADTNGGGGHLLRRARCAPALARLA